MSLDMEFDSIDQNKFSAELCNDFALGLGCDPSKMMVLGLAAGSVKVDMAILDDGDPDALLSKVGDCLNDENSALRKSSSMSMLDPSSIAIACGQVAVPKGIAEARRMAEMREAHLAALNALGVEHAKTVAVLENQIAELNEQHAATVAALREAHANNTETLESEHSTKISELSSKYAEDNEMLAKKHAEDISGLEQEMTELGENHAAKTEALSNQHSREVLSMKNEMTKMEAQYIQEARELSAKYEAKETELEGKLTQVRSEHALSTDRMNDAHEAELHDLTLMLKQLDERFEAGTQQMREKHLAEVESLKESLTDASAETDEMERKLQQDQTELYDELMSKHKEDFMLVDQELTKLQEEHTAEIENLISEHNIEKQELEKEMFELVAKHEAEIKALEEKHLVEVTGLKKDMSELQAKHESDTSKLASQHSSEVSGLKEEMSTLTVKFEAAKEILSKQHQVEITSLGAQVSELTVKFTSEKETLTKDHMAEIVDMKSQFMEEKESLSAKHAVEVADLRTKITEGMEKSGQLQVQIVKIESQLQQETMAKKAHHERHASEQSLLQELHQSKISTLEFQHNELKNRHLEARAALEEMKEVMDTEEETMREEFEASLAELHEENDENTKELIAQFDAERLSLIANHSEEKLSLMKKIDEERKKFDEERNEIIAKFEAAEVGQHESAEVEVLKALLEREKEHVTEMRQVALKAERIIDDLKSKQAENLKSHEAAMRQLGEFHGKKMAETVKELHAEHDRVLLEAMNKVETLSKQHEEEMCKIINEQTEGSKHHEATVKNLQEQHDQILSDSMNKTESITKIHEEEMSNLMKEHIGVSSKQEQKISELIAKQKELHTGYAEEIEAIVENHSEEMIVLASALQEVQDQFQADQERLTNETTSLEEDLLEKQLMVEKLSQAELDYTAQIDGYKKKLATLEADYESTLHKLSDEQHYRSEIEFRWNSHSCDVDANLSTEYELGDNEFSFAGDVQDISTRTATAASAKHTYFDASARIEEEIGDEDDVEDVLKFDSPGTEFKLLTTFTAAAQYDLSEITEVEVAAVEIKRLSDELRHAKERRKDFQHELDVAYKHNNLLVNKLESKQSDEIEELNEKHAKEIAELNEEMKESQEHVVALNEALEDAKSVLASETEKFNRERDEYLKDLESKHENEIQDMSKRQAMEITQIEQIKAQKKLEEEIEALESKHQDMSKRQAMEITQIEQIKAQKKLEEEIEAITAKHSDEMTKLTEAHSKEIEEFDHRVKEGHEQNIAMGNDLKELTELVESLKREHEEYTLELERKHTAETETLQDAHVSETGKLRQLFEELERKHTAEAETLQDAHVSETGKLRQLLEEGGSHTDKYRLQLLDLQAETDTLKKEHGDYIQEITRVHAVELENLRSENFSISSKLALSEEDQDMLLKDSKHQVKKLTERHSTEIKDLHEIISELNEKHVDELSVVEQEKDKILRKKQEILKSTMHAIEKMNMEHAEQLSVAHDERNELRSNLLGLIEEHEFARQQHIAEIAEIESEMKMATDGHMKLSTMIIASDLKHDRAIQEYDQKVLELADKHSRRLAAMSEQHKEEITKLKEDEEALRQSTLAEMSEQHEEEIAKLKEDEEALRQSTLAEMSEQHEEEITKLKEDEEALRQSTLAEERSKFNAEIAEAMEISAAWEKEKDQLIQEREAQNAQLSKLNEELLSNKDSEELMLKYQDQVTQNTELKNKYEEELSKFSGMEEMLRKELSSLEKELESTRNNKVEPEAGSQDVVEAEMSFDMDFNSVDHDAFSQDFVKQMSESLGVDLSKVLVLNLSAGSIVAKFALIPDAGDNGTGFSNDQLLNMLNKAMADENSPLRQSPLMESVIPGSFSSGISAVNLPESKPNEVEQEDQKTKALEQEKEELTCALADKKEIVAKDSQAKEALVQYKEAKTSDPRVSEVSVDISKELIQKQALNAKLKGETDVLRSELAAAENEVQEGKEVISQLFETAGVVDASLAISQAAEIAKLEQELAQARDEMQDLLKEIDELKGTDVKTGDNRSQSTDASTAQDIRTDYIANLEAELQKVYEDNVKLTHTLNARAAPASSSLQVTKPAQQKQVEIQELQMQQFQVQKPQIQQFQVQELSLLEESQPKAIPVVQESRRRSNKPRLSLSFQQSEGILLQESLESLEPEQTEVYQSLLAELNDEKAHSADLTQETAQLKAQGVDLSKQVTLMKQQHAHQIEQAQASIAELLDENQQLRSRVETISESLTQAQAVSELAAQAPSPAEPKKIVSVAEDLDVDRMFTFEGSHGIEQTSIATAASARSYEPSSALAPERVDVGETISVKVSQELEQASMATAASAKSPTMDLRVPTKATVDPRTSTKTPTKTSHESKHHHRSHSHSHSRSLSPSTGPAYTSAQVTHIQREHTNQMTKANNTIAHLRAESQELKKQLQTIGEKTPEVRNPEEAKSYEVKVAELVMENDKLAKEIKLLHAQASIEVESNMYTVENSEDLVEMYEEQSRKEKEKHQAQISKMVNKHMQELDILRSELSVDNADLLQMKHAEMVGDLEYEIGEMQEKMNEDFGTLQSNLNEQAVQELKENYEKVAEELNQVQSEFSQQMKKTADKEILAKEAQQNIEDLNAELKKVKSIAVQQEMTRTKFLEDKKAEIALSKKEHSKFTMQTLAKFNKKHNKALKKVKDNFGSQIEELQAEISKGLEINEELSAKMVELRSQFEAEKAILTQEHKEQTEQTLREKEQEIAIHQAELDKMARKWLTSELELQKLVPELTAARKSLIDYEELKKEYEFVTEELHDLNARYEVQKETLQKKHEQHAFDMISSHGEATAKMVAMFEDQHKSTVDSMVKQHKDERLQFTLLLSKKMDDKFARDLMKIEAEVAQKATIEIEAIEKEMDQADLKLTQAEEALAMAKKLNAAQIDDLHIEYEKKIEEIKEQHALDLFASNENLSAAHQANKEKMSEILDTFSSDFATVKNRHKKQTEEASEQILVLEERVLELTALLEHEKEALVKEHEDHKKQMLESHGSNTQELISMYEKQSLDRMEEHQAELEKVMSENRKTLDNVRKELKKNSLDMYDKMTSEHSKEVQELENEIMELEQRFAAEISRRELHIKEKFSNEIRLLERDLELAEDKTKRFNAREANIRKLGEDVLTEATREHASEISKLRTMNEHLTQELLAAVRERDALSMLVKDTANKLIEAEDRHQVEVDAHKKEVDAHAKEMIASHGVAMQSIVQLYEEQERKLVQDFEEEISELNEQASLHIATNESMEVEHHKMLQALKDEHIGLTNRFAEEHAAAQKAMIEKYQSISERDQDQFNSERDEIIEMHKKDIEMREAALKVHEEERLKIAEAHAILIEKMNNTIQSMEQKFQVEQNEMIKEHEDKLNELHSINEDHAKAFDHHRHRLLHEHTKEHEHLIAEAEKLVAKHEHFESIMTKDHKNAVAALEAEIESLKNQLINSKHEEINSIKEITEGRILQVEEEAENKILQAEAEVNEMNEQLFYVSLRLQQKTEEVDRLKLEIEKIAADLAREKEIREGILNEERERLRIHYETQSSLAFAHQDSSSQELIKMYEDQRARRVEHHQQEITAIMSEHQQKMSEAQCSIREVTEEAKSIKAMLKRERSGSSYESSEGANEHLVREMLSHKVRKVFESQTSEDPRLKARSVNLSFISRKDEDNFELLMKEHIDQVATLKTQIMMDTQDHQSEIKAIHRKNAENFQKAAESFAEDLRMIQERNQQVAFEAQHNIKQLTKEVNRLRSITGERLSQLPEADLTFKLLEPVKPEPEVIIKYVTREVTAKQAGEGVLTESAELKEIQSSHESEILALQRNHEVSLKQSQWQLTEMRHKLESATQTIESMQKQSDDLMHEHRIQIEKLTAQHEEMLQIENSSDTDAGKFAKMKLLHQEQISYFEMEMLEMEERFQIKITELRDDITKKAQIEIEEVEMELEQSEQQERETSDAYLALRKEMSVITEKHVAQLDTAIAEHERKVNMFEELIMATSGELKSLSEKYSLTKKSLHEQKVHAEALEVALEDEKVKFQTLLEEMNEKYTHILSNTSESSKEALQMSRELGEYKGMLVTKEEEALRLQKELIDFKNEAEVENSRLKAEISRLTVTIKAMKNTQAKLIKGQGSNTEVYSDTPGVRTEIMLKQIADATSNPDMKKFQEHMNSKKYKMMDLNAMESAIAQVQEVMDRLQDSLNEDEQNLVALLSTEMTELSKQHHKILDDAKIADKNFVLVSIDEAMTNFSGDLANVKASYEEKFVKASKQHSVELYHAKKDTIETVRVQGEQISEFRNQLDVKQKEVEKLHRDIVKAKAEIKTVERDYSKEVNLAVGRVQREMDMKAEAAERKMQEKIKRLEQEAKTSNNGFEKELAERYQKDLQAIQKDHEANLERLLGASDTSIQSVIEKHERDNKRREEAHKEEIRNLRSRLDDQIMKLKIQNASNKRKGGYSMSKEFEDFEDPRLQNEELVQAKASLKTIKHELGEMKLQYEERIADLNKKWLTSKMVSERRQDDIKNLHVVMDQLKSQPIGTPTRQHDVIQELQSERDNVRLMNRKLSEDYDTLAIKLAEAGKDADKVSVEVNAVSAHDHIHISKFEAHIAQMEEERELALQHYKDQIGTSIVSGTKSEMLDKAQEANRRLLEDIHQLRTTFVKQETALIRENEEFADELTKLQEDIERLAKDRDVVVRSLRTSHAKEISNLEQVVAEAEHMKSLAVQRAEWERKEFQSKRDDDNKMLEDTHALARQDDLRTIEQLKKDILRLQQDLENEKKNTAMAPKLREMEIKTMRSEFEELADESKKMHAKQIISLEKSHTEVMTETIAKYEEELLTIKKSNSEVMKESMDSFARDLHAIQKRNELETREVARKASDQKLKLSLEHMAEIDAIKASLKKTVVVTPGGGLSDEQIQVLKEEHGRHVTELSKKYEQEKQQLMDHNKSISVELDFIKRTTEGGMTLPQKMEEQKAELAKAYAAEAAEFMAKIEQLEEEKMEIFENLDESVAASAMEAEERDEYAQQLKQQHEEEVWELKEEIDELKSILAEKQEEQEQQEADAGKMMNEEDRNALIDEMEAVHLEEMDNLKEEQRALFEKVNANHAAVVANEQKKLQKLKQMLIQSKLSTVRTEKKLQAYMDKITGRTAEEGARAFDPNDVILPDNLQKRRPNENLDTLHLEVQALKKMFIKEKDKVKEITHKHTDQKKANSALSAKYKFLLKKHKELSATVNEYRHMHGVVAAH